MIDDCVHKFYETANERKVVGRSDPKNVYTYCENGETVEKYWTCAK